MKIAFFIRSLNGGGAERVAAQLATLWTDMGCDVVLLTQFPPTEHEFECRYAAREQVRLSLSGNSAKFADLKSRYELDAVVFNDAINGEWFAESIISAKKAGLRVIIINHHTANNWMYGCGNTQELFVDNVLRNADAMVCVDRMWALWWAHRGIKTVFIANPVCIRDRSTASHGAITLVSNVDEAVERLLGKNNIIWIGRIGDALKRPELAIQVFSRLSIVNRVVKMTMLGNITEIIKRQLTCKIPVHIKKRIEFPGFVENVEKYLEKVDAHLFTSVTEVTIPQAVLEAQMSGIDTVAFDQPVLRESYRENGCGQIEEKWRRVLSGEAVECDFDSPEVLQALMDELHRSQQWFARHHLPELSEYRRIKARVNPLYLFRRLIIKMRGEQ